MLIRFGLGGQMSGSVGGVTAGHNKGGQYLRNRSIPTNPNTVRQQAVREGLAVAAQNWKSLSLAVRQAWESYAVGTPVTNRLGESITLSGFNMYCRAFAFWYQCGEAGGFPSIAPAVPGLASLGTITAISLSAATGLTVTGSASTVDGAFMVALGPSISAGVSSFKGPYTAFILGSDFTGILGAATAGTESVNRYGVPIAGERRPLRIAGSDALGRLSNVLTSIVTVVA